MDEITITVKAKLTEDKTQFNIYLPSEQEKINIDDVAKLLSGALMLCIRTSDNETQLMGEIMQYLQNDFGNPTSFVDAEKF